MILIHSKSEQISLGAFDKMVQQIQQAIQQIQDKDTEIKRLTELCEKNKIDTKPSQGITKSK